MFTFDVIILVRINAVKIVSITAQSQSGDYIYAVLQPIQYLI